MIKSLIAWIAAVFEADPEVEHLLDNHSGSELQVFRIGNMGFGGTAYLGDRDARNLVD